MKRFALALFATITWVSSMSSPPQVAKTSASSGPEAALMKSTTSVQFGVCLQLRFETVAIGFCALIQSAEGWGTATAGERVNVFEATLGLADADGRIVLIAPRQAVPNGGLLY